MNYKKIVLEKLCSMGFEPTLVGDIGYVFNYEEVNFLYMPDDDDDKFLRIAIPQMFEVTDENRIAVLEAMHETSLLLKYAKVNRDKNSGLYMLESYGVKFYDNIMTTIDEIAGEVGVDRGGRRRHFCASLEVPSLSAQWAISGDDGWCG